MPTDSQLIEAFNARGTHVGKRAYNAVFSDDVIRVVYADTHKEALLFSREYGRRFLDGATCTKVWWIR